MTTYLGVDYGRKRIGLALSEGVLASPLGVLTLDSVEEGIQKVGRVIGEHKVDLIVIGISEGAMAKETKEFGRLLSELGFSVEYWDETLTSKDAQRQLLSSGRGKRMRRELLDAAAASIMLQSYLDEKVAL